jgi:hypothetical protein
MKAYGGSAYIRVDAHFLDLGSEWSASRPGLSTSGERIPGTHSLGGWVDPRAGLDDMEKWKFWPLGRPVRLYTDCAISALTVTNVVFWIIKHMEITQTKCKGTAWLRCEIWGEKRNSFTSYCLYFEMQKWKFLWTPNSAPYRELPKDEIRNKSTAFSL